MYNKEIQKFEKTRLAYLAAEKELADKIWPDFLACKDADEIYELIEKMPQHFRPVRRMYEQILRMEGDKKSDKTKELLIEI